jgi:PTH1 family peptidyl-tRNA hydrolase
VALEDDRVRLVVGLGNPGARYARTRHNIGRDAVEDLAQQLDAGKPKRRFAGEIAEARGPAGPVALLIPGTFMNDSGRSVGPAAGSLGIAPHQVLVVHDEIDIPFGEVRGKLGGGTAGHNGLRSIETGLGSRDFARIRVGVGRPGADWRGTDADWVLARFSEDPEEVSDLRDRAVLMIMSALGDGLATAIERFHARPAGEKASARAARRAAQGPDLTLEGGGQ